LEGVSSQTVEKSSAQDQKQNGANSSTASPPIVELKDSTNKMNIQASVNPTGFYFFFKISI
jgi:hypothetical protein